MNKSIVILLISFLSTSINLNCSNEMTLASYEANVEEYIKNTPLITSVVKEWLNLALSYIKKENSILEIGTAFGQDAKYIESLGYSVQRTDAVNGFIDILKNQGYEAKFLNILTDELGKDYSLIFANRVLHHFSPEEFEKILNKIRESLRPEGILAFCVKYGIGTELSEEKIGAPRYYCYWVPADLKEILIKTGFEILDISINYEGTSKRIYVIARKPDMLQSK